jgi:hypothetical protein
MVLQTSALEDGCEDEAEFGLAQEILSQSGQDPSFSVELV